MTSQVVQYSGGSPEFDAAMNKFLIGVDAKIAQWYEQFPGQKPTLALIDNAKYIKVWKKDPRNDGGSVYCFVDKTNGNILKGSWKAPVKNGVRGSILSEDNGLSKVNWHGTIYLR